MLMEQTKTARRAKITVDFYRPMGRIRAMHAVG